MPAKTAGYGPSTGERYFVSYLQPPPNASPVVVVKDFGGYVNEYAAQTEVYRRTGREVRIHECHSACTMALSLPNVCVYKDSIFKFHQAYDPRNHITNWRVSDELFHTYPEAVRDRLGTLTKTFTILRGSELIDLGIRDCTAPPGPRIMVAQATIRPIPDSMLAGGGSGWSMLSGRLQGMIPNFGIKPEGAPNAGAKPAKRIPPEHLAPDVPAEYLSPTVPLPPEKPASIQAAELETSEPGDTPPTGPDAVLLPPPRPKLLVAYTPSLPPIPFMQRIDGSQTILPARFVPFPRHPT